MSRRIFSLVLLAVLGLVGSGISPSYASAQPAALTQSNTSAQSETSAQSDTSIQSRTIAQSTSTPNASSFDVSITSVGKPTLREGDKLRVQAHVVNKSDSPLNLSAELRATATFTTRSHLLAFIGKSDAVKKNANKLTVITEKPQSLSLAAHSQTTITLEADTAKLGWSAAKWGPRGVEVSVASTDGKKTKASDHSLVIVEPSKGIKPAPTGLVIPLTDSRSELATVYTAKNLTDVRTQPTERMKNLATTMTMKGVSVIADPAYADLSKAPQTILSPTADADIVTLLDLKRNDLARSLVEESFKGKNLPVRVKNPGSFNAFAEYEELGASAFILDSSAVNTGHNGYATPAAHTLLKEEGSSESVEVLLNDSESAQSILDAPNALQARQNALALSAMTYLEQPAITRPQLLYLDVSTNDIWKTDAQGKVVRDYSQLAEAASALMNAPWVQPAHISNLLDTPPSSPVYMLTEKDTQSSPLTTQALDSIETHTRNASTLASLVTTPESVLSTIDNATVFLYSQNWNKRLYKNALKDFSVLADDYGKSVSVASVSTINLVAQQADIPVRVQNNLNIPATVTVELDSIDARLSSKKPVTVELPPASTNTVSIPVSARGSGNVQAEIRLYDSQGHSVGEPHTVKIRVRAEWENNVTIVLGVIFALMLVLGIVRSVRRGRRSEPVAPRDYTQAHRSQDLAFANRTAESHLSGE